MTLKHLSIKHKLTFITAACTMLALLVASAGLLYYDLASYREKLISNLRSESDIIASNCSAALAFKDPTAVEEVLKSLRADQSVKIASVYTPEGALFAGYIKQGGNAVEVPKSNKGLHTFYEGDHPRLVLPIKSDKDTVGFLYIQSGMEDWYDRRNRYFQIVGLILALSVGFALILGNRLQRIVSGPILNLADTMRTVAASEQYGVRVAKLSNDEVGQLVEGFNTMLTEIEKRDQFLHAANAELEERVLQRTAQLQQEIAERKLTEEELVKSQRSLEDFFENATVGLHWLSPEGIILRANRTELEMLGYTADEYLGHSIAEFHEDKEVIVDILSRLAAGESINSYEAKMRCKDGSIKYVGIDSNVLWEQGVFVHTRDFTRDLTAHKEAQHADQAREVAERASEAKSQFLSRMSHELRTPMNAILGFAQLLQIEKSLSSGQKDFVGYILTAGNHLLKLINEVLDISRIEAGRLSISKESVKVGEVISEVVAIVQPLAAKRSITILDHASGLNTYILADRQRLSQVLINLVSNAIKYNIEAGQVIIEVENRESLLRLLVADTGPGIPLEKQSKMFTPFERLGAEDTTIEGTGLGLSVSKNLVEAMGGEIGLLPTTKGACFYVDFPITASPLERLDESALEEMIAPEGEAGPITVLLVEDNEANVRLVESILYIRPNCKLMVATLGQDALDLAREYHPDLVLLDLNLPDMDGLKVLSELKLDKRTVDIPVAMISADVNPGMVERVKQAGAIQYLTKPFDISAFLALLDSCSAGTLRKAA